jgi:hypothetical protein
LILNPNFHKSTMKLTDRLLERLPGFHSKYHQLQKQNDLLTLTVASRTPDNYQAYIQPPGLIPRLAEIRPAELRRISLESGILRRCQFNITQEVFRRGIEIRERFAQKCENCGEEFDEHIQEEKLDASGNPLQENSEVCPECKGHLREPDKDQKKILKDLLYKANENGQSLTKVLKCFDDDLEMADDGWLLLRKEYFLTKDGDIEYYIIKELVQAKFEYMQWVGNEKGELGNVWRICLMHRNKPQKAGVLTCPECGMKTHDVIAVCTRVDGGDIVSYYIRGEVLHRSKFNISLKYGKSPLISCWRKAQTIIAMETYMEESYTKRRMPAGILTVMTNNWSSLKAWWREQIQMMTSDPMYQPIMPVDPTTGVNKTDYIKFMNTMDEMQYIDVRREFTEECAALYGVTPIFYSNTKTSGGLNNEGLQLVVQNRTTAVGQAIYNDDLFLDMQEQYGVTDYEFFLPPSEEEDEMAKLQRFQQWIVNAKGMLDLGYEVEYTEDGDFEFSTGKAKKPEVGPPLLPPGAGGNGLEGLSPANQTSGMPDTGQVRQMEKNNVTKAEEEGEQLEKEFWSKATNAIIEGALWQEFADLSKSQNNMAISILTKYFRLAREAFSFKDIQDELVSKIGITPEKAEAITRTEYNSVSNLARKIAYQERMADRGEVYQFDWSGPDDHRTSKQCKEITERAKDGLRLEELEDLVKEVSIKYGGPKWKARPFVAHINCRHKPLRKL